MNSVSLTSEPGSLRTQRWPFPVISSSLSWVAVSVEEDDSARRSGKCGAEGSAEHSPAVGALVRCLCKRADLELAPSHRDCARHVEWDALAAEDVVRDVVSSRDADMVAPRREEDEDLESHQRRGQRLRR